MEPSHGIQQNHSKPYVDGSMLDMENPSGLGTEKLTNTLKTIQHPKPQPERPSEDGSSNWPTSPRNIGADVGGGPQDLRPSRGSQPNGKDRDEPSMSLGKHVKDPECSRPDYDEEEKNQQDDLPDLGMLAGP